ncbi:MAG: nucleotidyltransferase domain-containing protein [Anaerolineales bacterium]|nr:nucleotidyltransferase domain-containing protein [Anaerolineales bacterium]
MPHLSASERLALTELLNRLEREYDHTVLRVILYGSTVRGDRSPDSDVDLLIITHSDDWRTQEPIRFLVARLSNQQMPFCRPGLSAWSALNACARTSLCFMTALARKVWSCCAGVSSRP